MKDGGWRGKRKIIGGGMEEGVRRFGSGGVEWWWLKPAGDVILE
jgi:hypothetical protein